MPGPFSLLVKKLLGDPSMVDAGSIKDPAVMTPDQAKKFRQLGIAQNDLRDLMEKNTEINFERTSFYREIDRAITYPLIGAALDLYAGVATNYSQLQDATVWITGDSNSYVNTLTEMLNFIGCEEKIYDWAWTMAAYGDMFVKVIGVPGQGIVAIEDDDHPLNVSRVDYMGRLIGFYKTPIGLPSGEANGELMPPWEYVHFRILGQKRKRPDYQDPMYTEFRTVSLIAADTRRATTRYGSSMLTNALPVYKKLKLAEDSLLLARLSRGILRNMFKIKVDGNNMDAISEQIQMYSDLLKRAQALDLDTASAKYADNYQAMNVLEDIFVPVWGDIGDLVVDKLGGEADIRFIVDIDELRNQLSCALRVPLQLLGGYTKDLPGSLGTSAIERLDIRFAQHARRLQRALIEGVYRLCQIHLAYLNMSPDLTLFEVNMSQNSSAEEEELRESLDKGADVVSKFMDMVEKIENVDKVKVFNYLNEKILKLNDFDLNKMMSSPGQKTNSLPPAAAEGAPAEGELPPQPIEGNQPVKRTDLTEVRRLRETTVRAKHPHNTDLRSFLPMKEGVNNQSLWESTYKSARWKETVVSFKEVKKNVKRK
jgi:hypothetical protein